MATSPGRGSRRRIEKGASDEVALCAAQDFTVLGAVDANAGSVLVDILISNPDCLSLGNAKTSARLA